jgi:SAM-dependent methyltransferase
MDSIAAWGSRAHAMCPRCGANERARLQYLVVKELAASRPLRTLRMVHFSPERQLQPYFRQAFGTYRTAGIWDEPVDFPADLTKLPFEDGSWDVLFASHVLEHVQDDERALAEIRRVLRPGGLAILPVPIAGERTVEYGEPNPREAGHVRAPGRDYFDRYRRHFARVEVWDSARPRQAPAVLRRPRSMLRDFSLLSAGSPTSKLAVETCAPLEYSSSGEGARCAEVSASASA